MTTIGDPTHYPAVHHSAETVKEVFGPWPTIKLEKRAATWAETVELYRKANNLTGSEAYKAFTLNKV